MGINNLNPTLNIIEGYVEEEGLEWDISDLREIPEEFEDWGDSWNSPPKYEDRNSLFLTPRYDGCNDECSPGNESDPDESLEELQLVLQTPFRYQNTWVAGNSPWDSSLLEPEVFPPIEQLSMLTSTPDMDSSRTDLDMLVEIIEFEENIEKMSTEVGETMERREVEGREETKQFEGDYDGSALCQEPSWNPTLLEPEASPPIDQLSMIIKEDILLSGRDWDQPIEARCETNSLRTDLDILVEMIEHEMKTEDGGSALCREPAENSSLPFEVMESDVVPPVEQLSTPSGTPAGNLSLPFDLMESDVVPPVEQLSMPSRTPDGEDEKRLCDIWTTIVPSKVEQSCDFHVQSWKGTEKLPGLQENEVVETGELGELFNRACGVQEPAKVEGMSHAKAANDIQHLKCTGARPKIKIWQNNDRIRSDENCVKAARIGDLMACELDTRSVIPEMQVEAFRRLQYANTYETRNGGWNRVHKCRGDNRIMNDNGAEQQVCPQQKDIGYGGCNGPG